MWQNDTLSFSNNTIVQNKITKHHILSVVSQIFDPLGLVGPCIMEAKLIVQKLWKYKYDWDSEVSPEIQNSWHSFVSMLHLLNNLKIPRWVLCAT